MDGRLKKLKKSMKSMKFENFKSIEDWEASNAVDSFIDIILTPNISYRFWKNSRVPSTIGFYCMGNLVTRTHAFQREGEWLLNMNFIEKGPYTICCPGYPRHLPVRFKARIRL